MSEDDGGHDNGSEANMIWSLDPADAMRTANLMDALEENCADGITLDGDDQDDNEVPPTQLAEVKQEAPRKQESNPLAEPDRVKCAGGSKRNDPDVVATLTKPHVRQVDSVNVPKPKHRGRSRATLKQLRQTKLSSRPDRLAVHKYPSDLTVSLYQLLVWARNTPNVKFVMEVLEKYPVQLEDAYLRSRTITCQWELVRPADYTHNFVIPPDLTQSMQAAVTNTRSEKNKPGDLDESVKKQGLALEVVASIDPKMWKFSGQFVGALTDFYAVKAKDKSWFQDRKWLEQDWRKIDSDVDVFAHETNTAGISVDSVRDRHQAMANEVIAKFTSSRLRTEFVTLSDGGMISFEHIVGSLCREWLNDSPIDFCLDTIRAAVGNYIRLSSLSWALGWPRTLKSRLADIKFIVHPVNLRANHWGVIIACLKYDKAQQKLRVHTYMYEPLIDDDYHEEMETVWEGIAKVEDDEESEG